MELNVHMGLMDTDNSIVVPGTSTLDESILSAKSEKSEKDANIYFNYDPNNFMPMFLYRTANDIVASAIIHSSSEGLGRYEIGRKLGINIRFKRGNRKVSNHITQVVKAFPDHIGTYQKMEGKYRMLKYFYKATEPGNMAELMDKFKEVSGVACPFKLDEAIKFPDTKLNTLRISDVTLKRFIYILEMVKDESVIITISKVVKHVQKKEADAGYNFEADKKSILKCLLALEKKKLCNVFQTDIQAEDLVQKNFEVITLPEITTVDSSVVREAINKAIANFHAENRIFPTGQPRAYSKHQTVEELKTEGFDTGNIDFNHMSIEERHKFMKLIVFSGTSERSFAETKIVNQGNLAAAEPEFLLMEPEQSATEEFIIIPEESEGFEFLVPPLNFSNEPGPSTLEQTLQISQPSYVYDPSVNYGYQSGKMVRCAIMHEFAWHFVYYKPKPRSSGLEMPTYFDRFPPGVKLPAEGMPLEILESNNPEKRLVYDEEPDSPFRYVPPLPSYRDVQPGWFMVRDLVGAMPLSIFVLLNKKLTNFPELDEYLSDNILRHTLISDLPEKLRNALITKKTYMSILHLCIILCGCGLMRAGKSFDGNRSTIGSTAFFFVGKSTFLYDTSSSQRGYAKVTPPIEQYDRYEYNFETNEDIHAYWNHLKAIAQATPLTSKSEKTEIEEKELLSSKKYGYGTADRDPHEVPYDVEIRTIAPTPPNDGCAGMDPALFVHLKRHWDADQNKYSEWFLHRARKYADFVRPLIEDRVANSQKIWSSISSYMSSDGQFYKKKEAEPILSSQALRTLKLGVLKRKSAPDPEKLAKRRALPMKKTVPEEPLFEFLEPTMLMQNPGPSTSSNTEVIQTLADALAQLGEEGEILHSPIVVKKEFEVKNEPLMKKRKRPYDEIDILSQRRAVKIRAQFSPKEKDMLIMIRALGFFLNPVYRFWLDPAVVRDVMHEYVPESRTKTVQSLMAAGVREMGKPSRLAHLQYIVKTLASYKQMREIRNNLAHKSFPKDGANEEKKRFFHSAFDLAHRLLFQETQRLPSYMVSDKMFDKFLQANNVYVSNKSASDTPAIPTRSQKPESLEHIQHCVAFNAIMMLFLSDTKFDEESDEDRVLAKLIDHISAKALTEVLDRLRSDGLISRIKSNHDDQSGYKAKATYSLYYRHFFNHRYRNDLLRLTQNALENVQTRKELSDEDDAGVLLTLSSYLISNKLTLDLQVPDSVVDIFGDDSFLSKDTKQLRYLENTDLRLENIRVIPQAQKEKEDLPTLEELLTTMVVKVPLEAITNQPKLETVLGMFEEDELAVVREIYKEIYASNILGRNLKELESAIQYESKNMISRILDSLVQNHIVFECGVDTHRYVLMENAKCWMMTTREYGFFIRPWCTANGDVNPIIFRWMSEGVLFTIHSRPCIILTELETLYGFVLQPVHLHEILAILEKIRAIRIVTQYIAPITKESPFTNFRDRQETKYVMPVENGVERFARIFTQVEIPEHLYMNVRKKELNG